jgi:hypothetical protein
MPYIKQEDRELANTIPTTAGELNFNFTETINRYLLNKDKLNYQAINDVIGALEGAKQEFIRRVVNPYEDTKIIENGDVYDEILLTK